MSLNKKILMVDDFKDESDFLYHKLKNKITSFSKSNIKHALCHEEALELLKSFKPDLIMLDLNISGKTLEDGLEFLSFAKNILKIPVYIYSGSLDPNDIVETHKQGANNYIYKNATPEKIIETLGF